MSYILIIFLQKGYWLLANTLYTKTAYFTIPNFDLCPFEMKKLAKTAENAIKIIKIKQKALS